MYVSPEEYENLSKYNLDPAPDLKEAERDIDSLTFNRIKGRGFDRLTDFQKELVKQAVVDQADFKQQYAGLIETPLASYSINGVSMTWDNAKIKQVSGIYTSAHIYGMLRQTGLTYRGV